MWDGRTGKYLARGHVLAKDQVQRGTCVMTESQIFSPQTDKTKLISISLHGYQVLKY